MALPNQIDDTTPLGADNASLLDDQIIALKTFILDIFGLTDDTAYTAGLATLAAAGLQSLLLQNAGADVGAAGRLGRNGIELQFHDGNGVRQPAMTVVKSATTVTVTNTATPTAVFSTTIPLNHLSAATDGSLRVTIFAHVTNSSGAAHDLTANASFDGATIGAVITSIPTGSTETRRLFEITVAKTTGGNVVGHLTVAAETAMGGSDQNTIPVPAGAGVLGMSVEWDAALATLSFSKVYAVVEWLP